jgi:hypothetical protein
MIPKTNYRAVEGILLIFLLASVILLAISITTYLMVDYSQEPLTIQDTRNFGKVVYPSGCLFVTDFTYIQSGGIMNFWWSANRSTDMYIMNLKDYDSQKNQSEPPDRYFWRYSGKDGNITILSDKVAEGERGEDYAFTVYTGNESLFMYEYGLRVTIFRVVKKINPTLLSLNVLLMISMVYPLVKLIKRD